MPRKRLDILEMPELKAPVFSSGTVCELLEIKPSRLANLLDYRKRGARKDPVLRPSVQIAEGRGRRNYFRIEDVYLLAIALHLAADGFGSRLITNFLGTIQNADFYQFDKNGQVPHPAVAFVRAGRERRFEQVPRNTSPQMGFGKPAYYLLDVASVVKEVDARISGLRSQNSADKANLEGTTNLKLRQAPSGAAQSRVNKVSTP
jgi:hypothetical protein